jgi:hypothetical protein
MINISGIISDETNLKLKEMVVKNYRIHTSSEEEKSEWTRGKKRQTILNDISVSIVKDYKKSEDPNYTVSSEEKEVKIPDSRGDTFKVDAVLWSNNNHNTTAILAKNPNTSYNKNFHNYENTVAGEVTRLFGVGSENDIDEVFFVDIIPTQVYSVNKKEETKISWESENRNEIHMTAYENDILSARRISDPVNKQVNRIVIRYTLKNKNLLKEVKDFLSVKSEDLEVKYYFC